MKTELRAILFVVGVLTLGTCAKPSLPNQKAPEELFAQKMLPGRYTFREYRGWLVRFDSAKGEYCAVENLDDHEYIKNVQQFGKEQADGMLPGGGTCRD